MNGVPLLGVKQTKPIQMGKIGPLGSEGRGVMYGLSALLTLL